MEAVTLIAALFGIGETAYSLANQPSAPKTAAPTPAQQQATADKTKQGQIAAITQAFPSIQSQTGGALSPQTWVQLAELIKGQAGQPGVGAAEQDILKGLFGTGENPFMVTASGGGAGTGGAGLMPPGTSFG